MSTADEPTAPAPAPAPDEADRSGPPDGPPDAADSPGDTGNAGEAGEAGPETGREAIIRAARRAFTLRPYAEVTMRGIAAAAGVSPSLIVKRFGSKEVLFNTVVDFRPAAAELFAAPLPDLGRHLVLTMVDLRDRLRGDPLLRVVFSLGIEDERTLLRARFREQVTDRLTGLLTGPDARLRAELVAGQLLGLGATLSLHRPDGATAHTTAARLAELYAPGIQHLVDGT
ncbi:MULTISPECIES: TetR family transcriptional regulator [unclassified Streptomyces]|uniref:TetR/AcrR family transcriptional regulator n=1 Tax=unclassified Streptomyces TaxID=2593676 RepID=UPI002E344F64|nr:TetR family transcriptional regulator [Streptomyces sp. NBC_01268]